MTAYLLLLLAVLSRFLPLAAGSFHSTWMNFTAVGAVLLYFGARRSWREMIAPVVLLAATDFFMTTHVYHYSFQANWYLPTWLWYAAAMVLGRILLSERTTGVRVASASVLGPTSFFFISNFAVWIGSAMYAKTLGGLATCYIAGIPFYRNDVISTSLLAATIFAVEAWVRRSALHPAPAMARK